MSALGQRQTGAPPRLRRRKGERDGHDAPRVHTFLSNEIGDAVRDDTRLAGAGTGQDQQRSLRLLDGFALAAVEVFEDLGNGRGHI